MNHRDASGETAFLAQRQRYDVYPLMSSGSELPVAVVLGLVVMTTPALVGPATGLPALTPLIADQAGSVELARTSRWKCVRRGRC